MNEMFSPDQERATRARTAAVTASRRVRRRLALAGIGLTLLGAAAGSAATAAVLAPAGERGGDSVPRALLKLFSELSTQPGFVSAGPAQGSNTLDTTWAAEPPSAAMKLIDEARDQGIGVTISIVLHSRDELWLAATTLVRQLTQDGIAVTGFGLNRAYDTIELLGPLLSADEALQSRVRDIAASTIGTGYTVTFIPEEPGPPLFPTPVPAR